MERKIFKVLASTFSLKILPNIKMNLKTAPSSIIQASWMFLFIVIILAASMVFVPIKLGMYVKSRW